MERARGKNGWNRNEEILFVRPSIVPASGPNKKYGFHYHVPTLKQSKVNIIKHIVMVQSEIMELYQPLKIYFT